MARKSGFVRRNGVMRRETLWIGSTTISTTMAAASAVLTTILNAAALALRPFTIVRTRGVVIVRSDQISALQRYDGAFGMAVVSEQASTAGVASIPTPTTDSDSDLWYVYERVLSTVVNSANGNELGRERIIDSKAMRKVEDGSDVVSVVENPLAAGCVVDHFFRTLVKLH